MQQSYFDGEVTIPIFATAFGDIITWEDNKYIGILKYRYQDSDIISTGFEDFFRKLNRASLMTIISLSKSITQQLRNMVNCSMMSALDMFRCLHLAEKSL